MRRPALALALFAVAGCGVELEHALDEATANEVWLALERAGLPAEKVAEESGGRFRVRVARADAVQALAVLRERALPRRRDEASAGLLPSATEEQARRAAQVAAELERTLETLPRVAVARVHLALPAADLTRPLAARSRPTATVVLRLLPGATVSDAEVTRLVANAVEGLQREDVALVRAFTPAETPGGDLVSVGPLRVARTSRPLALTLLTAGLVTLLGLALAVAWLAGRRRA